VAPANNKILTRDNLVKRREVDDGSCLYCRELESVDHLFLKCCVAGTLNPWQNGGLKARNTMMVTLFMLLFCGFCGQREIIFVFREKDGEVYK
jgi:hypothetical protein